MGRPGSLRGAMQGMAARQGRTCESLASWESLLLCRPCSPSWLLQGRQQILMTVL